MALYVAYNTGIETAVQTVNGGQSLATGAKVTLQIGIPSGQFIRIAEYGVSMDGSAAATPATVTLQTCAGASSTTLGTAHSTTTVKPYDQQDARASTMTMSTAGTAYGATIPASRTALRVADRQYIAPTSQFVKIWPEGRYFEAGAAGASEVVQLILNTSATVNVLAYIIWDER